MRRILWTALVLLVVVLAGAPLVLAQEPPPPAPPGPQASSWRSSPYRAARAPWCATEGRVER